MSLKIAPARGRCDLEISKTSIRRGLFVIGTARLVLNVVRRLPPVIPVKL